MVLELKHYVAGPRLAFHRLECAAAHQKFRAVFAKDLREGDAVGLVPFGLNDIDAPNPISLRQSGSMLTARSPQSEQRKRSSNFLNASMSAAPHNLSRCNSRVFPQDRHQARALISKSSATRNNEERSGRICLAQSASCRSRVQFGSPGSPKVPCAWK
jgi:hypothetical protein